MIWRVCDCVLSGLYNGPDPACPECLGRGRIFVAEIEGDDHDDGSNETQTDGR